VGGRAGRRWGLCIDRYVIEHGPSDRDHRGPEARVGSEDAVVAMAMDARRRNEAGRAVEQLEGSEAKLVVTVHIGLGEPVDQASLRRGERPDAGGGVKTLQGERPPRTVAKEPLETRPVLGLDADGAVNRAAEDTEHRRCEAAAGPTPGAHVRRRGGVEEPAPGKPAQDAKLYGTGQGYRVSSLESGGPATRWGTLSGCSSNRIGVLGHDLTRDLTQIGTGPPREATR
jgi:hypothetical protein